MKREEVLQAAIEAVTTRNNKEDSFATIADLWSAYLGDHQVTPADVCRMMALLKIARSQLGISTDDSSVDAAGYMACCAEIVEEWGK